MSAATDPLARASDHVPDAGGSSGVIPAGLWQQRAGRHVNLPLAPTAVGAERGASADLLPEALRPHY